MDSKIVLSLCHFLSTIDGQTLLPKTKLRTYRSIRELSSFYLKFKKMHFSSWLILLCAGLFNFTSIDNPPNLKLVVFEGSDWCVNCIQLEKNVLSDAIFIEYSQTKEIEIERIDFPQRKKQDKKVEKYNAEMAEKYGFDGTFPTVILVEEGTNELIEIPNSRHKDTYQFISFIQEKTSSEE